MRTLTELALSGSISLDLTSIPIMTIEVLTGYSLDSEIALDLSSVLANQWKLQGQIFSNFEQFGSYTGPSHSLMDHILSEMYRHSEAARLDNFFNGTFEDRALLTDAWKAEREISLIFRQEQTEESMRVITHEWAIVSRHYNYNPR